MQRQSDIDDEGRIRKENEMQYVKMVNENSKLKKMKEK